jgi:hypothetical protein
VCVYGSLIADGSQPSPHIIPEGIFNRIDLSILTVP